MIHTHYAKIDEIILAYSKPGSVEGGLYYQHLSMKPRSDSEEKTQFLFRHVKNKRNIAEIGFNAGHSAIVLLASPLPPDSAHFFDINEHKYVVPCLKYVEQSFPKVKITSTLKNSAIGLSEAVQSGLFFDFIHVDGSHNQHNVVADLCLSRLCLAKGGIMVIDDMEYEPVSKVVSWFITTFKDMCVVERGKCQISLEKLT